MIGKPVPRKEDHRFLTGRGLYVADVQLPGKLRGASARLPRRPGALWQPDGLLVPRASDVPAIDVAHVTLPTADNPLGIKSVGESGLNSPPPALAAAVEDALEGTVRITRLPITPEMVLGKDAPGFSG
jgi:CO/xanthine dehydrogenase Mo-binding subunit